MELPIPNYPLKARIIERYGSQSNFAFATRTDEAIISKIVRGRRKPTEAQRVTWAGLLGADVDTLFNRETAAK